MYLISIRFDITNNKHIYKTDSFNAYKTIINLTFVV